jgi:hypothetical protein
VEQGRREERWPTSSNTHAIATDEALEWSDTQENSGFSGAVVTARTIEMLQSKKVQAYKGSSTEEPRDGRRHEIHLPLIHSPL